MHVAAAAQETVNDAVVSHVHDAPVAAAIVDEGVKRKLEQRFLEKLGQKGDKEVVVALHILYVIHT